MAGEKEAARRELERRAAVRQEMQEQAALEGAVEDSKLRDITQPLVEKGMAAKDTFDQLPGTVQTGIAAGTSGAAMYGLGKTAISLLKGFMKSPQAMAAGAAIGAGTKVPGESSEAFQERMRHGMESSGYESRRPTNEY